MTVTVVMVGIMLSQVDIPIMSMVSMMSMMSMMTMMTMVTMVVTIRTSLPPTESSLQ